MRAICFTEQGKRIIETLTANAEFALTDCFAKYDSFNADGNITKLDGNLSEWVEEAFTRREALIFVAATGIAVRAIAGCVQDKLTDSPVVVIDDRGIFVIPLVSGHMGGANELAMEIADVLGAIPVITTSTDRGNAFSVDLFAKENNLAISDRNAIKKVSSKAIEGKAVTLSIRDYPPVEDVDVLVGEKGTGQATITLCPKEYAVGIGLKKGKSCEEIETLMNDALEEAGIGIEQIGALATIDIKLEEDGLRQLSQKNRIPLIGYEKSILEKARGEFAASEFVMSTVGVDNVCERSAVIATDQGELVVRKCAKNGVTVAIARKRNGR